MRRPRRVSDRLRVSDWLVEKITGTLLLPEHERLPHLSPLTRSPIVFITAVTIDRHPILACDRAHHILREIWLRSPEFDGWSV